MKTKSTFISGFVLFVLLSGSVAFGQAKVIDPKYAEGVGKSTDQFVTWAKGAGIWNPNDMTMAHPGQDVFFFQSKPVKGWAIQYRYIFKNDSCKWMSVRPASLDGWPDEIAKNYDFKEKKVVAGKTYHIYLYKKGGHKIAFEERAAGGFENKVLVYPL